MTTADENHLADSLRAGLDDQPVDAASLLVGARQGARRIRRRRRAGAVVVAAVVVVVAVPVGVGLLVPEPGEGPVPASSEPTPSGPPTAALVPPTTTEPSDPARETAPDGSVAVPLEAMLGVADVPAGSDEVLDGGSRRDVLTLTTSLCGPDEPDLPGDDRAVGGRDVYYPASDSQGVTTAVRLFEGEGAAAQMAYLADALVRCRTAATDWAVLPVDGLAGDEAVLAAVEDFTEPGFQYVVGAIREGGTIVGVSVTVRGTPEAAVSSARDLLALGHERLLTSGLPAAFPG